MNQKVEMTFWDAQHGHATYLRSPNNRHIAIDLGIGSYKTKKEFSPLKHLKNIYNIQRLDYLVITHPHLDHIDDILNFDLVHPKVLLRPRHLSSDEIMEDVREEDIQKFEKYCQVDGEYNTEVSEENRIENPSNYGGLKISTFSPRKAPHDNFNNHSIIVVFEYESTKVVIPGDNEKTSFEELLESPRFKEAIKDSDILLAPHHGRESGFFNEFIDLVNPRLTIVSDGRFCDSSANSRYNDKSRGWIVHKNGEKIKRKCLTTNNDGCIHVSFGKNSNSGRPFLSVDIN